MLEKYDKYIRDRITQLRLQKGVSEYRMSFDLGHSKGYMHNISSGRSLPRMQEFIDICNYFEISPRDFFDDEMKYPDLIQKALSGLNQLSDDDLLLILSHINRLLKK